jgi:hypothetical protein
MKRLGCSTSAAAITRWCRAAIKDNYLADEVERIERRSDLAPWQTRQLVKALIEARYTLPE